MFKKLKEKKGFTLVELIVVLVILAILAALLIPALTGYIDKAKEKSITETRQTVMAAQTLLDEDYAAADTKDASATATTFTAWPTKGACTKTEVAKLAEVDESNIDAVTATSGKITKLVYKDTKVKKQCTYEVASGAKKGTYKVEDISK